VSLRRCSTAIFEKFSAKASGSPKGRNSGTLHRRLCALRAARHFRWSRRTGQVRRRSQGDASPLCYTPHGAPQALHNSGRLAWGSGPNGETPQYTGVDFIIARDEKIAALYVYLDAPPASRQTE
jgi:hypothetical protein